MYESVQSRVVAPTNAHANKRIFKIRSCYLHAKPAHLHVEGHQMPPGHIHNSPRHTRRPRRVVPTRHVDSCSYIHTRSLSRRAMSLLAKSAHELPRAHTHTHTHTHVAFSLTPAISHMNHMIGAKLWRSQCSSRNPACNV